MPAVRLPLLAASLALAGMAVGSAVAGQAGAGASTLEVSSGLSVQSWSLDNGPNGTHTISALRVAGVPESVVGQQMTVYLNGSTVGSASGTITSAGITQIPVTGVVYADQVRDVSIVIAG